VVVVVGKGGGEYSRILSWDLVQDLGEMKDQGSGGVTPSPAEGEVFLALLACCSPISHGFQRHLYISQSSIL
jgi:hypothetical protein